MQNIYKTFEFDNIKESVIEFCKTELGKIYIENLEMMTNFDDVKKSLDDLSEVKSVITRFGPFPIHNSANAIKLIDIAKKTALLTCRDLSLIAEDVLTSSKISTFLNQLDSSYTICKSYSSKFYDLSSLEKEIHRVITPSLTVSDNATQQLKEIRNNLKKAEHNLEQRIASLSFSYSKYLNDDNVTIRDGHFVLPVKTVDKSKVPGIIYDVSDSGATTFIEPLEIVQLNNEITSLKVQENEEVRKILKSLTSLCLLQEEEIINNNKIIAHFDFVSAKAFYANSKNAEIANLSNKQEIILKEARHPLISDHKVVSNDFYLDENKRIIIISGPNAGGKTVSLKTLGLLVLMNQCGLAVPANKATLGIFKHIYIDIGDNQSLSENLSTFSAHVSQLAEIINIVGGKDLILFDELGTGTDPKEGEGLAIAVTKFLESKHVLAMISSHFDGLKEYAFLSDNIDNASMEFDEDNLLPTYRFRQSTPGHSYALAVAKRYGIKECIIDEAKKYISSIDKNGTNELLEVLQKKLDEASKLQNFLDKREKDIEKRFQKLQNDEKILLDRRDNLLKEVKEDKQELIQKARDEIDFIISQLNNENIKLHEVINLKKNLDELEDVEEEEIFDEEIKVDDYVLLPAINVSGKVLRINGKKARINTNDGLSFDVSLDKLHKIAEPKSKPKVHASNIDASIASDIGLELNIIGLHVDEAKYEIEKYIDGCRVRRHKIVRIIHGFGSGTLRKITHEYLANQKDLTYRLGNGQEGGSGATVITFK